MIDVEHTPDDTIASFFESLFGHKPIEVVTALLSGVDRDHLRHQALVAVFPESSPIFRAEGFDRAFDRQDPAQGFTDLYQYRRPTILEHLGLRKQLYAAVKAKVG